MSTEILPKNRFLEKYPKVLDIPAESVPPYYLPLSIEDAAKKPTSLPISAALCAKPQAKR
jgi:hypothetical protein